jgi:MFS family permease
VGYVVRNASLRGLAVTMSVGNLAYGGLTVILPVLVLTRLRAGAGLVGALWALQGVATVVAGLTVGRLGSEGRERRLLALGFAVMSVALVLILLPGWTGVVVAMLLAGASVGAVDIAIFSLRQRRTDPAWFGRAISVSMALNFAGMPIGSGLAGPVVARSLTLALVLAAALSAASSVLCVALIPRRDPVRATTGTN